MQKSNESTKKFDPIDPIPYEFREYVRLVSALAEFEATKVFSGLERGSIEVSAYSKSDRYHELKRISQPYFMFLVPRSDRENATHKQIPNQHCIRNRFEGTPYKICIDIFWQKMREVGVSNATIKIIENTLEQHRLETLEWGKNRAEKKAQLKELVNNIGKKMPE